MSLYPIYYFKDKDYTMPEIAIFHAHYPKINVQYAEISFRMNDGCNGAEFQVIDCDSDYIIFILNLIWRQCFGGANLEYAEAKEAEDHKEWVYWNNKIWDAINDKKNKIDIKELFIAMLQEESGGGLQCIFSEFIEPYLEEE